MRCTEHRAELQEEVAVEVVVEATEVAEVEVATEVAEKEVMAVVETIDLETMIDLEDLLEVRGEREGINYNWLVD